MLESISPPSSSSTTGYFARQNHGEKSEVLTSSALKGQLEEKKKDKEEIQKLEEAKSSLRDKSEKKQTGHGQWKES